MSTLNSIQLRAVVLATLFSGVNNYTIAASNNDAQRLGGGSNFMSTDRWANFSY